MPSYSPKSIVSPMKSSKKMYKTFFIVLIVVLAILSVMLFTRKKSTREFFEGASATLMYFYMPKCGHCQKFNPEWEKLQPIIDQTRAPLRLNKIDGTDDANSDLVNQYNVNGYPTIILEIGNKSEKYDGDRSAEAILKWVSTKVPK